MISVLKTVDLKTLSGLEDYVSSRSIFPDSTAHVYLNKIKKIHNQINEERYAKKANITFFFFGISLYLLSISLTLSSKVTHLEPLIMFLSGFTCACGVVFISFSKILSQLYLNSVNRR